jgi:hypothetical protein
MLEDTSGTKDDSGKRFMTPVRPAIHICGGEGRRDDLSSAKAHPLLKNQPEIAGFAA